MSSGKILFRLDFPHGPGLVNFAFQTGSSGNHLATTGSDGTISIYNRQGHLQDRIVLQALCTGLAWDNEGDILSIITNSSPQIILWDINTRQKHIVDTGLRDSLSCLLWSKSTQILAVASTRGNLAIYNHRTTKRTPILGKHSKKITCGAWSKDNILALGCEDKTFSLSSEDGDSLRVIQLRDVPSDMCFAEIKTDERVPGENTISMIIGKKTLYLYHLPEPDSPAELGFQHKYGSLLQHKWFGDGYILLGFQQGNVVAISTHPKEVGQELWQIRNHRDSLSAIAVSRPLEQIASCGDDKIKIHSISNLQETVSILTVPDQSGVRAMDWSVDGQLIAASTTQGSIYVFVTKMSVLSTVSFPRIAILSSLAEVSIYNYTMDKIRTPLGVMALEIEPSVIAVGPFHFACGMNNHAWFYDLSRPLDEASKPLNDREYIAEINDLKMNAKYCAALIGGRVSLHPITTNTSIMKDQKTRIFPENTHGMQESVITSIILTTEFLIFSNDLGHLVFFSLEFWTNVVTYRHTMGIRSIFSDADGTKIAFIDDHNQGYIYSPCDEEPVMIPSFPKNCNKILWDSMPTRTFVVFESKVCTAYIYSKYSINKKHVMKISETSILSDQTPLLLCDSELCLATSDGNLSTVVLTSHLNRATVEMKSQIKTFIDMRRFDDAWHLCKTVNRPDVWCELGKAAIAELDINFAIRVHRQTGNAAVVHALKAISSVEDINFISGFCALLLGEIDKAKTCFAKSINPIEALDLCRDLLQWEQAIALAETLAPEQIPLIAREYAHQLEFANRHAEALANYEKGMDKASLDSIQLTNDEFDEHKRMCEFGIARTNIKLGNFKKGIGLVVELNDKQLFEDCAEALAAMNETVEAARLFELAENWDQACQLYVQLKAWQKVQSILPHVTNSKMHAIYAKSCETEGNFNEAIEYYRNAGDLDSVVRIHVEELADPHSAAEIVIETRSIDGSKLLAQFYQGVGDYEQALRFLILCGSLNEAFILAKKHNKIRQYAELLEQSDTASPSNFLSVAEYFESEKYTLLAGRYYYFAKEYSKALKHLLKASTFSMDENAALVLAVDCAASSNDDRIANQLIEFLLGERDGSPKDPKYLFGLYMARKQFKEAAKTAVIISNQEQIAGNYRNAHDLLFSMYQELRKNNLSISAVMVGNLALLHRYTLVRTHVKIGDHHQAAKLLIQVAANISRFPAHTVPILTSTVIECHRVGFQKAAFSYASMLMRSENRSQIDQKYAKKIEAIVRKAPNGIKDAEDSYQNETNACPICDFNLQIMELSCHQCKTNLPMCIATGQHIAQDDVAACPACDFLCFKTPMIKILNATNQCPMCSEIIDSNQLNDVTNISEYLNVS